MIPFSDLGTQYRSIQKDINDAVLSVLASGQYVLGPEVRAFEEEFAAYCGCDHAIGVNSGTSALHLALLGAGVGPGDEVITTPLTFVATAAAIFYTGARPVFADVDPKTLNLDPEQVARFITPRTKVILPVHLHGKPADMAALDRIAKPREIVLIEDAAQAHGAEIKGKRVGGFGSAGCFSFYPGKNLGAYGEAGIVTTNNMELASKVRSMRDWGAEKKYEHDLIGYNYRMEALQGAVLRVKLRSLEKWTEKRITIARQFDEAFRGLPLRLPELSSEMRHVFHVYPILVDRRDEIQGKLTAQGIQTGIHYPIPVHLQKAYEFLGYKKGDFPHAEAACKSLLSLPLYSELSEAQVENIISAVKSGLN